MNHISYTFFEKILLFLLGIITIIGTYGVAHSWNISNYENSIQLYQKDIDSFSYENFTTQMPVFLEQLVDKSISSQKHYNHHATFIKYTTDYALIRINYSMTSISGITWNTHQDFLFTADEKLVRKL